MLNCYIHVQTPGNWLQAFALYTDPKFVIFITMIPDFDALSHAARNIANRAALHDLWKSALGLPDWYFVATDDSDDAQPVIGISDGKPHLLAFTDEQRAAEFSAIRAKKRGHSATSILSMSVDDAVDYLHDLREQVDGIVMNSGEYGFSIQPVALLDMRNRYRTS